MSEKGDVFYFVEVKYRRMGGGLDAITPKKQEQMRFAAELYLKKFQNKSARLAAIAASGDNYQVTDFLVLE